MSDLQVVAMTFALALGAWLAFPIASIVVVLVGLVAIGAQRSLTTIAFAFVLAACLSDRSWASLDSPLPATVDDDGILVRDAEPGYGSSVRAEVRLDGRHFMLVAYGSVARDLTPLLAGEHAHVTGEVVTLQGISAPAWRRRHIAGTVRAESIELTSRGATFTRSINVVRGCIERGAGHMSVAQRALLTGLIYGDDRAQLAGVEEDFRNAGLSHLLAVSGQNVAFMLLLAKPVLERLSLTGRSLGGFVVLLMFGTLSRWEPSVIRAEAMALVVMFGVYVGRPVSTLRALSLATSAALLIDPFLVGSIGFLLSVLACLGMALFGEPLGRLCAGPSWLARSISFSIAAELAILPVHVVVFGLPPAGSLVANVLAEPIAGLIMTYGAIAGIAAGLLGEPLASLIHLPDQFLIDCLRTIAHDVARLPPLITLVASGSVLAVIYGLGIAKRIRARDTFRVLMTGDSVSSCDEPTSADRVSHQRRRSSARGPGT